VCDNCRANNKTARYCAQMEMLKGAEGEGKYDNALSSSGLDSADKFGLDKGGDGIASGDCESQGKRRRGRTVDVDVDDKSFLSRCNDVPPPSNKELMSEFGCSYGRVQRLKRKLACGLNKTEMKVRHTDLFLKITFDSLRTRWVCEETVGAVLHRMAVPAAVNALAVELGVSAERLRQRMKDVERKCCHSGTIYRTK
jgi:hypothetical protein